MTPSESYRALAEARRNAAAQTAVPSPCEMHERSAMAWEQIASAAEDKAVKAATNAAAKANC